MGQAVIVKDFLGIQTNVRTPNKSAAQICENLDLRSVQGDLTLRPGMISNFATSNLIPITGFTGVSSLGLHNFYVPDVGGGSEVWCAFQSAQLIAQTGLSQATPANITVLLAWIRPYWSGSAWVDAWALLNTMRLTTIKGVGVGVGVYHYSVTLDYNETIPIPSYQGFTNQSSMVGWTITNITKNQTAGIIVAASDGTRISLELTNIVTGWSIGDVVLLSQNYIPYSFLTNMGDVVTSNDISFHKIINDLRIGFGGQQNRLGLSIGYRQKYFNFTSFDDTTVTTGQIQNYSAINGIVIDPYYCYINSGDFAMDLSLEADSHPLQIAKYFFRMTAVLDDYEEFLVADQNIDDLDATHTILCTPRIRMGPQNKRITKLRIYCSVGVSANLVASMPYFLVDEISISQITLPTSGWRVNKNGFLTKALVTSELFSLLNAANIASDTNATLGFTTGIYAGTAVLSVNDATVNPIAANPSRYSIATVLNSSDSTILQGFLDYQDPSTILLHNTTYFISFWVAVSAASTVDIFVNGVLAEHISVTTLNTFEQHTLSFMPTVDGALDIMFVFGLPGAGAPYNYYIDNISVKVSLTTTYDTTIIPGITEMSDLMGYTPTYIYALSWDQAILNDGKVFLVNPYIDQRYVNKVFFSVISGDGVFCYDVIPAQNYYDAQNFSGNDLIGIAILPNGNILALRANSCQIIDTITGAVIILDSLKGCVSRNSIVSFGDKVIWCGNNDIYETNGISVISLTVGDIRNSYQALTTKANIMAIKEEIDSAYRFWTGNSMSILEYTLTKKGWITSTAGSPIGFTNYASGRDGVVRWFSLAIVSKDNVPNNGQTFHWKSTKLDLSLMGISRKSRILITSLSLEISATAGTTMTMNVYYDGVLYQTITVDTTKISPFYNIKPGMSAKIIELEITGVGGNTPMVVISSINLELVVLPTGRFG